MALSKRVLHEGFAVEVNGIDMRTPPSPALRAEIESIIDEYLVVVFPGQDMSDEQQIEFCRPFGELQRSTAARTNQEARLNAEMTDASNLAKGDKPLEAGDRRRMNNLGSRRWHTDGSFNRIPVKYSFLSGRVVAERGGETQFADMRAAYDALPDDLREKVEDLRVEHNLLHSRAMCGFPEANPEERATLVPFHQRLVRRHPRTGRKSLYLSSHASHVVGWPKPEGMDLLYELTEIATQPAFVYSHKWKAGDVVLWDNRFTMHRARRHTPETAPRDMRRVSIMDTTSTLEQTA
jgi:alpha-ketoglutarate-dependent 2,4-dichlorophenoxyacetate dioxygenase